MRGLGSFEKMGRVLSRLCCNHKKREQLKWSFRYRPATVAKCSQVHGPGFRKPRVGGRCVGVTSHSSQHPWATKQVPKSCFCDSAFHLRLGPSQDACLPTFFGEWLGNSDPRDGQITKMCCYTLIPRSSDGLTTVKFDMI